MPDGFVIDPEPEPIALSDGVLMKREWDFISDLQMDRSKNIPGTEICPMDEVGSITGK